MGLAPPADQSIASIYLSQLPDSADEAAVRTVIAQTLPSVAPSKLKSVVYVAKSRCAFANFKDRESAELAAAAWSPGLEINGQRVVVKWGRSRVAKPSGGDAS